MLSCKEVTEKADDYLENDLSLGSRIGFKLHLFMCVNCRRYISQIQLTINTLRKMKVDSNELEQQYLDSIVGSYKQQNKK